MIESNLTTSRKKEETMKKKMFVLTATIGIILIATFIYAADNGPEKVTYEVKMGTVTFDHAAHQKRSECSTCHHTGDYAKCKSCHGTDTKAPKAKDAYHKNCKSCHKELKKGPTKCKECHIK
jgi:hypothetical protein